MISRSVPSTFAALRRFALEPQKSAVCDLCSSAIGEGHDHLYEPVRRSVSCACTSCAILFSSDSAGQYRRVATRAVRLGAAFGPADWETIGAPVRLAFFGPSDVHNRLIGLYPSAGGTIEASFPIEAWSELVGRHPELVTIEPDVEGILVSGLVEPATTHRISVDVCFRVLGTLRASMSRPGADFPGVDRLLSGIAGGFHA